MMRLRQKERDAIVLRFFENRTIREVATALGLQEAAAQKRVNRATEKLRGFFGKRGLQISAGGLTTAVAAHALQLPSPEERPT
jgi:DNA-directed RNA polymerase specialized sigma24 family protein